MKVTVCMSDRKAIISPSASSQRYVNVVPQNGIATHFQVTPIVFNQNNIASVITELSQG